LVRWGLGETATKRGLGMKEIIGGGRNLCRIRREEVQLGRGSLQTAAGLTPNRRAGGKG
jgi:hypothetical protein